MLEEGSFDGKTVGILADQDAEGRVNDVIVPGLEDGGVDVGSTAVLTITGEDTTQAQSQLDAFIERWRTEESTRSSWPACSCPTTSSSRR